MKRQVYTLLTATGGVSGTFNPDVIGVKNKVELFYDANHVYLCDHCKLSDILTPGQLPGLPASPPPADIARLAAAIDAAIDADVTLPPRVENLLGLSRPQLINALTQLTGEVHTGAEQAGFQVTNTFLRLLLDPFAETRGAGGVGSAMGFAPERSERFPPSGARLCIGAQGARGVGAARRCQPPLERLGLGLWRPRQYRRRSGEHRQP